MAAMTPFNWKTLPKKTSGHATNALTTDQKTDRYRATFAGALDYYINEHEGPVKYNMINRDFLAAVMRGWELLGGNAFKGARPIAAWVDMLTTTDEGSQHYIHLDKPVDDHFSLWTSHLQPI